MIHYKYWIGILLGILVLVMSTIWSSNSNLLNFFSFASAISSLILAVLAILITTQSNSSVTNSLSSIASSASRVEDAASRLDSTNAIIGGKLDEIPTALGVMADKLEKAQESWGVHQPDVVKATEAISKDVKPGVNLTVSKIIEGSPPGGLIALYAAARGFDSKKTFNPSAFMTLGPDAFVRGYIRALDATGLIKVAYKNSTFEIKNMGDFKANDLNDILNKLLLKNPYVRKYKPQVDAFFDDIV